MACDNFVSAAGPSAGIHFIPRGSAEAAPAITVFSQGGGLGGQVDLVKLTARLNADPDFLLRARYWDCRIRLEVGTQLLDVVISGGNIVSLVSAMNSSVDFGVRIAGPWSVWINGNVLEGLTVEGDLSGQFRPYQRATERLVQLVREYCEEIDMWPERAECQF